MNITCKLIFYCLNFVNKLLIVVSNMKKILLIIIHKQLIVFFFAIIALFYIIIASVHFLLYSQVLYTHEAVDLLELEKENAMLKNLFSSLIPNEQKSIFEDEYRNIFMNAGITPPPPLSALPLSKVITQGVEISFKTLIDDPKYLRPIYDPDWKDAYYRGWLYLPDKNIEARHRIFAFSLGGSENYDISGSLGFKPESNERFILDNHRNINFIIYGFEVKDAKVFQNQVALIGTPKQTGTQVISIVQNELLPDEINTKDFLFQLCTPEGYEIDFLYHNIIRYEHLMKEIEEHTVHPSSTEESENISLEWLLRENAALKQELTYFIPDQDEIISHQVCDDFPNDTVESSDIAALIQQGKKIPFVLNYKNPLYKQPLYSRLWKTNYKRKWAYIPKQIESNMHRLHIIPQNQDTQYDFFGTLGFHEKYLKTQSGYYGLLVYNFDVSQVVLSKNQLLLLGVPSRTGVEVLSINSGNLKHSENYSVKLITPDCYLIDCSILTP